VGYKLLPSSEFFFLPSLFFLPKIDFGQWAQAVVFVGEDGLNWLEMEFQSRILTLATYVN